MSHAFWFLVNQQRQIDVAQRQVQQLSHINDHLRQQQQYQAQQAALAQTLFETERISGALRALAGTDPFSAGVLSRLRLDALGWVRPDYFHAIESKRAWAHATDALAGTWNSTARHPQMCDLANRVVGAVRQLIDIRIRCGDEPHAAVARLTHEAEDAEKSVKKHRLLVILAGVGLVVGGVGAAIIGTVLGFNERTHHVESSSVPGCFMPVAALFTLLLIPSMIGYVKAGKKRDSTASRLAAAHASYVELDAFMRHPEGGRLLEAVAARHPPLNAPV